MLRLSQWQNKKKIHRAQMRLINVNILYFRMNLTATEVDANNGSTNNYHTSIDTYFITKEVNVDIIHVQYWIKIRIKGQMVLK